MPTLCPHLPTVKETLPITHTRAHREECGVEFYIACLELAQSLWQQGLPAQAMLQLNKSLMASLPANAPVLEHYPIPYRAFRWIIKNAANEEFIGNPPRHFQHLATRMNFKLPQPELRVARAWCCLHIAESLLDSEKFPRDQKQIKKENLIIPSVEESISVLKSLSPHTAEIEIIAELLEKR